MSTIKAVAEACGVSKSTVSQVLSNGGRPVSAQTREQILRAARALDYRPNAIARGLSQKRMNTIGLAFLHGDVPTYTNPFLMMVLDGVLSVCTRRRQTTMLSTIRSWEDASDLPELSDGRCDGVLLLVPPAECPLFGVLRQRNVPFVLVNARDPQSKASSVDVDNVRAAYEITEYLLKLGHERIAFVHLRHEWVDAFASERQEGYRQAMTAWGRYDAALANLSMSDAEAIETDAPDRPTALFCSYDSEAIRLMKELQRRGVRIPEEVSIVSFDDIPDAAVSRPALTTVRQPITGIGERAAEMLLELIDGTAGAGRNELLPTELVIRSSAAPPPGRGPLHPGTLSG
jgi:LacI family transcriptional regulator